MKGDWGGKIHKLGLDFFSVSYSLFLYAFVSAVSFAWRNPGLKEPPFLEHFADMVLWKKLPEYQDPELSPEKDL